MEKRIYRQPVTLENLDKICDYYVAAGWKEIDIISPAPNQIEAVIFEWTGSGPPYYPNISSL